MNQIKVLSALLLILFINCSNYSSYSEIETELGQIVKLLDRESNIYEVTKVLNIGVRKFNQKFIAQDSIQIDSLLMSYPYLSGDIYLEHTFLIENKIASDVYYKLTSLIDSTDILSVRNSNKYIGFNMGGFIDSNDGYLFLKQGQHLEIGEDYVFGASLLDLTPIHNKEGWYEFVSD